MKTISKQQSCRIITREIFATPADKNKLQGRKLISRGCVPLTPNHRHIDETITGERRVSALLDIILIDLLQIS